MKHFTKSLCCAIALAMTGCGSTENVAVDAPAIIQHPELPESYQTLVDFGILDKRDAELVVLGYQKSIRERSASLGSSALSQVTDDGNMFAGFFLAQLFGGGVSLTDFFTPYSLFQNPVHKNLLAKTYFFVEVDEDCDEDCGQQKMYDILSLASQHAANNYLQLLDEFGDVPYQKPDIAPLKVETAASGTKVNMLLQPLSKSYTTDIKNLTGHYDLWEGGLPFFTQWDSGFQTVNGKRYFGSLVSRSESYSGRIHRKGHYEWWVYDNSMTLGMAKASETYPEMIYIETRNMYPQVHAKTRQVFEGCQGDLMITQGKLTYTHLFPECPALEIGVSNKLNVTIHDAVSEVLSEEELEEIVGKPLSVNTASVN